MREIHVANNGLMLVRGAHVVSIDGTTIRAALGWGATNFAWDVQTDATTLYFDATGKRMTYTDLQIGDIITISGMLVPSESQSIIQAQYVREQE
jgi:RecJ-like exonuclease